jgi:hypothetical protein
MPVEPHRFGRIFTAGVGVAGEPIRDDWRAEDQDHLWFSARNTQVSKSDHIFALGAGRGSIVVGLFEVGSSGFEKLPRPEWDPEGRWPWALGVRPLAGVPPREAVSVEGVRAPRRTAAQVKDSKLQSALYEAIDAGS